MTVNRTGAASGHIPQDTRGTTFFRKRRGRKLHFIMSGPTAERAADMVRWTNDDGTPVTDIVYEHHMHGGAVCSLVRPTPDRLTLSGNMVDCTPREDSPLKFKAGV
jgi:hypothetical protein